MKKGHPINVSIFLLQIFIILNSFLACAQTIAPAPEAKVPEKTEAAVSKVEGSWQQQWEDLVKKAQKEGKLSIYSGMEPDTVRAIRKHFGEKYNLDLDIVSASSSQLNPRLFMERQNGLYIPDVYMEGPTSPILEYKPRGIIQRLDKVIFRPDVLDEKAWWGAYGPFFDKDHMTAAGTRTVLATAAINTRVVKPGEITSYSDFLDPKWKGKILLGDPTVSGGPQAIMHSTLLIMGEDYIRKLADQIGMVTRDKRLLVEWVVREKYPIAFGATDVVVQEFKREGVTTLDMVAPKEGSGTTATGVIVLFDPAPHPDAARLFINWFLTKEGQEAHAIAASKTSRRLDVSEDHLSHYQRVKPGTKYVINDEEFYLKQPERQIIIDKYYKK